MPIRLVLAEDHYLVREGIRRLLETQPDLEVAAVCGDLGSLLAAVDAERPDVVVTDIRMPPGDADEGIRAAERLRETNPEVGVVVLSQYANPSYALALLEGGSARRAYLLKERVKDLEQLVAAIRAVAEGGSVIDPKVVEALVAENARGEESPLNQLTPRERDVLREMAEGKNNAAIAEALFLTERSVEKVIHSIFLKLGLTWETAVHKRVKAVILYLAESASVIARAGASRRRGCRGRAPAGSSAGRRAPRRGRAAGRVPPRRGRRPRRPRRRALPPRPAPSIVARAPAPACSSASRQQR